ncbi:putative vesicle-fusing ATPase [Rosa chinensis]|uniref:Putative vesicle-fusing ATPase n=1 Tax=Rosa chinensis TaxID=74649 RepID=A0A2P6S9X4_ROSCH|nr:putative vesicle-fusing ATPase [Rosa chinensis]
MWFWRCGMILTGLVVLFFDVPDSIATQRGSSVGVERVLNITKQDGVSTKKSIFVIGITNRSDLIELALLHPAHLAPVRNHI